MEDFKRLTEKDDLIKYVYDVYFKDIVNPLKRIDDKYDFEGEIKYLLNLTIEELEYSHKRQNILTNVETILKQRDKIQQYSTAIIDLDLLPKDIKDISEIKELTFLYCLVFIFDENDFRKHLQIFNDVFKILLESVFPRRERNQKYTIRTKEKVELLKNFIHKKIKKSIV